MIIAVSNRTKNDIIKYYGIDPEKLKFISHVMMNLKIKAPIFY